MTPFDQQRLIETILYILQRTGGLDTYHIFKVLYLAERTHLAKWGDSLVPDTFRAFKHGPVPVNLYFAEQGQSHKPHADKILLEAFGKDIIPAGDEAGYIFLSARQPMMDYLSTADIETLDEVIEKYAFMPYAKLEALVHEDVAWKEAYHGEGQKGDIMSYLSMARMGGASKEMIDYIREQNELEQALK